MPRRVPEGSPCLRGFAWAVVALATVALCESAPGATAACASGCATGQPATPTPRVNPGEGREVFAPKKPPAAPTADPKGPAGTPADAPPARADTGPRAWSIVLASFREGTEEEQRSAAERALGKIKAVPGLEGAVIGTRPKAALVLLGAFADPGAADAQALLKRVRETTAEGSKVFANAFFAPPAEEVNLGARPEHNLLTAREQFGRRAAATLQICVYGRRDLERPTEADLAEARRAAEEAAAALRRDGELAFYYHGARMSTVTVGVFTDDELKPGASPALDALRKRYPHNLYNGSGIREKARKGGTDLGLQKSEVVAIPVK